MRNFISLSLCRFFYKNYNIRKYQAISLKEERESLWISYNVKFYRATHLVSLRNSEKFIEHKVTAIEIYIFLNIWHKILGKPDVIGKNWFDIRVQQQKKLSELLTHLPVTWKKSKKWRPALYKPLHMIINFFGNFFLGRKVSNAWSYT